MTRRTIRAEPLTAEAFAPFGDVIEGPAVPGRADDLAAVLVGRDGRPGVHVLRAENGAALPLTVERMERHPLGSQAFVPMGGGAFFVVVAPAGEFDPTAIRAFVANGRQGINYRPGTWHHGFLAAKAGDDFLMIERSGPGENCDFADLETPLRVTASEARPSRYPLGALAVAADLTSYAAMMKIAAIALIALGVLGLVYGGFTYTRDRDAAKLGPIEIQVTDKEFVPVPLWAGVVALAAGAGLLLFGIPGRKV